MFVIDKRNKKTLGICWVDLKFFLKSKLASTEEAPFENIQEYFPVYKFNKNSINNIGRLEQLGELEVHLECQEFANPAEIKESPVSEIVDHPKSVPLQISSVEIQKENKEANVKENSVEVSRNSISYLIERAEDFIEKNQKLKDGPFEIRESLFQIDQSFPFKLGIEKIQKIQNNTLCKQFLETGNDQGCLIRPNQELQIEKRGIGNGTLRIGTNDGVRRTKTRTTR